MIIALDWHIYDTYYVMLQPPTASPASRRKDHAQSEGKPKMNTSEPIRDNVRKSLQEQVSNKNCLYSYKLQR